MIRSSKHSIKFCNLGKINNLNDFIDEYRIVGQQIIDEIWYNGYNEFIPSQDELNCPKYIYYTKFNVISNLSSRAISSITNQVCFYLSAATKKRKQLLYVKEKLLKENKPIEKIDKLLNKYHLIKPNFLNCNPELSSKCCDIEKGKSFDYFLRLKSIGDKFGHIKIPIKNTKLGNKWLLNGSLLNSFSISKNNITLRYNIPKSNKTNNNTKIVGIDQGMKDVATLSDKQVTPKFNDHNYSLETILNKLSRKKKGSKAFKKAQDHRNNFINWSINKLNFNDIKEVRLEKIWNIGYKKTKSRKLSHWTNTLIRDKIMRKCEELEVLIIEQDSSYRSQRCFNCGIVRKANRKSKLYKCKHCGYEADADFNASLNHSINLPDIDWRVRNQRYNLGNGFYWKTTGLYRFDGLELGVPVSIKQE